MHLISWSISLASTLLPLTTNRFGYDSDLVGWCFLAGNDESLELWILFSFFIIMVVCLVLMTYFSVRIFVKHRQMGMGNQYPEVQSVVDSVSLYPIVMVLNWTPNLIASTIVNFDGLPESRVAMIFTLATQIITTQNGTWAALIFFYKSKEARHRWRTLFRHICGFCFDRGGRGTSSDKSTAPEDFPDDSMFSITTAAGGDDPESHFKRGSDSQRSSDMSMLRIRSTDSVSGSSHSEGVVTSPARGITTDDLVAEMFNDRFEQMTPNIYSPIASQDIFGERINNAALTN